MDPENIVRLLQLNYADHVECIQSTQNRTYVTFITSDMKEEFIP